MENASKALLIAGAILLSILIISLGIIIYRQAAGLVNNNSMDELEITTYNTKFTQYEGDNVRATVVRSLLDQVNADTSGRVTVVDKDGSNFTTVDSTKTYTVSISEYSNGYVSKITVTEKEN